MEKVFDRIVDRTRARLDVPTLRTLFGAKQMPLLHVSRLDPALATIPATIDVTFVPAFAAPLPAEARSRTRCWMTSCNPARSASRSTGSRPAHDTRFGSSNVADTAAAV